MAFKITKKEVQGLTSAELLRQFELVNVVLTKETDTGRGVSNISCKSYALIKDELLNRLNEKYTYNETGELLKR